MSQRELVMRIKFVVYMLLLLTSLGYSQNDMLVNYLKTLQQYQGKSLSYYLEMDSTRFKEVVKTAYEAIEIASSELLNITKADTGYRNAQGDFLRAVKKRYSDIYKILIQIPVFVKAKIVSVKELNKGGFRQINLGLEPEYILKGKEPFLSQPEFEVFYREYEYVPDSLDYKVGKSYFFPLWDRGEKKNQMFAIATWISGDYSRFLIEDDVFHDKNNFFKMGPKIKWNEFILHLENMISKIVDHP